MYIFHKCSQCLLCMLLPAFSFFRLWMSALRSTTTPSPSIPAETTMLNVKAYWIISLTYDSIDDNSNDNNDHEKYLWFLPVILFLRSSISAFTPPISASCPCTWLSTELERSSRASILDAWAGIKHTSHCSSGLRHLDGIGPVTFYSPPSPSDDHCHSVISFHHVQWHIPNHLIMFPESVIRLAAMAAF